ncbi:EamA family transporter RarD [Nocardioides marmoriginsengisoli]|uniref:EamA family transporter RarD n=1 Tax=Nocardioides marmoriginsengisoli TaxID=661483 RepID=A0A3N0CFT3_9ACTN|nr:EamA family transporter RarD [Nocardioides marmoriginsengisoli]RNL62314.1 EamA family transporter RarD [Nocardioides marmoriginsengisoli]
MTEQRRGLLAGFAAYLLWGLFPLYWPLLKPAGALEILSHRIAWAVLTMTLVVLLTRRGGRLVAIARDRRARSLLGLAAVVVAMNWGAYIWGVNHHRVVETSLGYFMNPLVTVLLGVVFLGERLRRLQWVAVAIATVAVVGLTFEYGRVPWVALILAVSFGIYGLAKKQADVPAVESLTFETLVLAPLAIGYLVWLGSTGDSHFFGYGVGHGTLLVLTGVVTAVPLLFFGAAAIRVPLTTLGLLQYLAPVIQFLLGVVVLDEAMSRMRWLGFGLVWIALVLFTVDSLRHRRRRLRNELEPEPIQL